MGAAATVPGGESKIWPAPADRMDGEYAARPIRWAGGLSAERSRDLDWCCKSRARTIAFKGEADVHQIDSHHTTLNAEESVIGSVLIDGDSLHKVSSLIRPTDFYGEKNRWCYEAFLGLAERGEAINQVTVSHELALQERLDSLGGSAYLSHLVMVVPTSVHIEYYAGIVQRTSVMRQLIDAGGRIADIGYHESDSDTELGAVKG